MPMPVSVAAVIMLVASEDWAEAEGGLRCTSTEACAAAPIS
jgi:hypothetical protein